MMAAPIAQEKRRAVDWREREAGRSRENQEELRLPAHQLAHGLGSPIGGKSQL